MTWRRAQRALAAAGGRRQRAQAVPDGSPHRFHPSANDPRGATYNLRQSITAVGAGGLRGRGVPGATQTRLDYLPEHATDFAFASLSEEHGFFGASILLLLYLLVVWRALKIVTGARPLLRDRRRRIAFMFLFQVFVNTAMTMGSRRSPASRCRSSPSAARR